MGPSNVNASCLIHLHGGCTNIHNLQQMGQSTEASNKDADLIVSLRCLNPQMTSAAPRTKPSGLSQGLGPSSSGLVLFFLRVEGGTMTLLWPLVNSTLPPPWSSAVYSPKWTVFPPTLVYSCLSLPWELLPSILINWLTPTPLVLSLKKKSLF